MKKNEIRTFFNIIHKNELKWIKDINIRLDTIKLLEENKGRTLFDINHNNILFNPTPGVMEIKTNIKKSVQFSLSVVSNSLRPHGLQHARLA